MRQYLIAAIVCFVITIVALLFMGCATPIQYRESYQVEHITVTFCPPNDPALFGKVGLIERRQLPDGSFTHHIWVYGNRVDGRVTPASMDILGHELVHALEWGAPGRVLNPDKYR